MTVEAEPMADLDLRGVHALVVDEDGDLAVLVYDGDVCFRFEAGMGGRRIDAILGAERLISTMTQYVAQLEARAS